MTPVDQYLAKMAEMVSRRESGQITDAEEEALNDALDALWWEMSEDERAVVNEIAVGGGL